MKTRRFIISAVFTLVIVILYQFIRLNAFAIDLPRRVSAELFKTFRNDPAAETDIVLFDIGYVPLDAVKIYLETLESLNPKAVGVNLCNVKESNILLNKYLAESKTIITCDCDVKSDRRSSMIVTSENEVTKFRFDKDSYLSSNFCII